MASTLRVADGVKDRIEELAEEHDVTQREITEQLLDAGFQSVEQFDESEETEQEEAVGWCPHCGEAVLPSEVSKNVFGQIEAEHDCDGNSYPWGKTHIYDELLDEPPEEDEGEAEASA